MGMDEGLRKDEVGKNKEKHPRKALLASSRGSKKGMGTPGERSMGRASPWWASGWG